MSTAPTGEYRAAAEAIVADMLGDGDVPEPVEVPGEQPVSVANENEAETDEQEIPEFAPVDLEALGFTDDDEEPETPAAEADEDQTYEDYEDDSEKLRRENAKLAKKLKHTEDRLVETNIGRWRKKYAKLYPLANIDGITAASGKAFERAAALDHNKNYKILEPHLDTIRKIKEQLGAEATAEARETTANAWGRPTAGPGVGPIAQGEQEARIGEARKKGLHNVIKTMLMDPKTNPFAG